MIGPSSFEEAQMMKNAYVFYQKKMMCMRMPYSRTADTAGTQGLLCVRPKGIRC